MLPATFTTLAAFTSAALGFTKLYDDNGTRYKEDGAAPVVATVLDVKHDEQGSSANGKGVIRHTVQCKVPVLDQATSLPTGKYGSASITLVTPSLSTTGDEMDKALGVLLSYFVIGGDTAYTSNVALIEDGHH